MPETRRFMASYNNVTHLINGYIDMNALRRQELHNLEVQVQRAVDWFKSCSTSSASLGEDLERAFLAYKTSLEIEAKVQTPQRRSTDPTSIEQHEGKKYLRKIFTPAGDSSIMVDVYCVLKAFNVTCQATGHAVKKLLCAGQRGKGNTDADLVGAIAAINRARQMLLLPE